MSSACLIITRGISTSCTNYGKKNFRKFLLYGKRGSRIHKEREAGPNPELPVDRRGVREIGYNDCGRYVVVNEKIPQFIVPDLKDLRECKLKPYVTYESEDVFQEEFTAQDLFNAVYADKIVEDYKQNKLDADGQPLHPSDEEKLTPEEAKTLAAKTGSDLFQVDKQEVIDAYNERKNITKAKAQEQLDAKYLYPRSLLKQTS